MGRMFRIISDGAGVAVAPAPAEPAPFVEVGGPEGIVSSWMRLPESARQLVSPPIIEPIVEAEPVADLGFRPLSVAFHRFGASSPPVPAGVWPELVTYHFPQHPVSAEYRAVRDEIARQFPEPGPRAALFTAAVSQSGTTTVLLNLAASLAADAGKKVLVVDAGAAPAAAGRLGAAESPGVAEVLAQATPIAWAIQPTGVPNLHVLPAGATTVADITELPRLLAQLRSWFDCVLIDAGVWGDSPIGSALAAEADGVYLVSRQDDLDRPEFIGLRAAVADAGGAPKGYVTTRG